MQRDFALSYYGKLGSVESFQDMPIGEVNWYFEHLQEVKKKEKEEHDKRMRELQSKAPKSRARSPGAFRPPPSIGGYRPRR